MIKEILLKWHKVARLMKDSEESFEGKAIDEEERIRYFTEKELKGLMNDSSETQQLLFETTHKLFYKLENMDIQIMDTYECLLIENLDTSRVIDKLVLNGSYQEATTLLRANYERTLRILYCLESKKIDYITELLKYPLPISYTKMEKHLKMQMYGVFSNIAHSYSEKKLMPFHAFNNKGEKDKLGYLKKTTRFYNPKVAKKLLELNVIFLARSFLGYYKYIYENDKVYTLQEFENNVTKGLLENATKVEEIMMKINQETTRSQ